MSDQGPYESPPNTGTIKSRADLAKFLEELAVRCAHDQDWENRDLPSYLEAAARFVQAIHGAYKTKGETFDENQNYRLIAEILWAAAIYE